MYERESAKLRKKFKVITDPKKELKQHEENLRKIFVNMIAVLDDVSDEIDTLDSILEGR